MVVHLHRAALVVLDIGQAFNIPLDRLVTDPAIGLTQPVTIGVDTLLRRLAVLPHLVTLWHLGKAQAVRQDRLDERLARQSVGERHNHAGAFLREGEEPHFVAAHRHRQGDSSKHGQLRIRLVVLAQEFEVYSEAWAEVVADPGAGRCISHTHHTGKAWQVIAASEFGKLPLYAAADCVFHRIAIWLPVSVTLVIRSPWLMDAPGRNPGRAAIIAL
ncbi:hypothetical protein D3C86_801310 [compost metagenome]